MADLQLNDEHELQVQGYLRFAKLKRDQHVRETLLVIRDFKDDKLQPGEMYNYKELQALFKEMEAEVQTLVDKEIQHAYHTNALLVKMLLAQAQANGLELHVDTNQLENEFLLRTIANSENVALSRPASDFVRRNAQLSKLGTVATVSVQDAALDKRNKDLQDEVKTLTERLARLQEQTTASMRDRSGSTDELNRLRDQLAERDEQLREAQKAKAELLGKLQQEFANLSTQAAGAASASQSQFSDLERQLQEQRSLLEQERVKSAQAAQEASARDKEIRQLKDVLDGKLQDAPQVKQLRQMMQTKSTEVVELRKRLAKYEPQSIPSADNE